MTTTRFIIYGAHITENLLHHKASDVRRILEEKGYTEDASAGDAAAAHFRPDSGAPCSDAQTIVRFDDGGFVLEEGGVSYVK